MLVSLTVNHISSKDIYLFTVVVFVVLHEHFSIISTKFLEVLCVYVMVISLVFCRSSSRVNVYISDSFASIMLLHPNFVLVCPVWLSSPGGLLFYEEEMEGESTRGGGRCGETWRSGGKGKSWLECIGWRKNLFSISRKILNNENTTNNKSVVVIIISNKINPHDI